MGARGQRRQPVKSLFLANEPDISFQRPPFLKSPSPRDTQTCLCFADLNFSTDLQKDSFSGRCGLNIKYGFPWSVLPQRDRVDFRLLKNDVFQGFQDPSKLSFPEWAFWTSNMDFLVGFIPDGSISVSSCSKIMIMFQGFPDPSKTCLQAFIP